MSRQRTQSGKRGPELPKTLQVKLGISQSNRRQRTQVAERKQQRQQARKTGRNLPNKRQKIAHTISEEEVETEEPLASDATEAPYAPGAKSGNGPNTNISTNARITDNGDHVDDDQQSAKGSPRSGEELGLVEEDDDELSRGSREYSPELVLDANSNTFRQRQAEDDAEILALERKLGMRGTSASKTQDGDFNDLLEGLNDDTGPRRQRKADQTWLEKKRSSQVALKPLGQALWLRVSSEIDSDELDEENATSGIEDDFAGFESGSAASEQETSDTTPESAQKRIRENPYVAPMPASSTASSAKYLPPSLRKAPQTDTEKIARLKRQAQGHLNRLSEANIISIVDEFDKLYSTNPRQDVTTVIIDLLLAAFTTPSMLQNTYIILHAAFVAALYKLLGADFGAEMISRLVETFDKYHHDSNSGKQSLNLVSFMSNMFTFGVVSSTLVYDHIHLLLVDFGEQSAELLLRVIRDCGPQLRTDDPISLKAIVQRMNDISAKMSSSGQTINVRTRVMMDTITDLKNNKTKQATNAAGLTGEHLTRVRKAIGTLNSRQLRGGEPLGISRDDVLNSDKRGKWWLVGASWKSRGNSVPTQSESRQLRGTSHRHEDTEADPEDIDYAALARHHKLTTPTQRSIFTAILSADDGNDALQRISKLRLTRKQEPEIPKVILRLCRAEPSYNAYYAVLARSLLRDGKRYKFAFEVALWKFFEEIGEASSANQDEDAIGSADGANVHVYELANVARLYASLVSKGAIGIDVLKTLNIGFLSENGTLWLELFFIALFCQSKMDKPTLMERFAYLQPELGKLIAYFLRQHVRKSEFLPTKDDQLNVKRAVQIIEAALVAQDRYGEGDNL